MYHHTEFAKTSNTGVALAGCVEGGRRLLRGLPEDDAALEDLLEDESALVAVLWPSPRRDGRDPSAPPIAPEEVVRCEDRSDPAPAERSCARRRSLTLVLTRAAVWTNCER